MRLGRASSVEELQVVTRFENLRKTLLSEPYCDHLDKPLAYWALPNDRRLPLAFLGRTLKDLLNTPFVDLCRTPGIGQKKIRSFVKLLSRVTGTGPATDRLPEFVAPAGNGTASAAPNGFDPGSVSEVVWAEWRASVLAYGLGGEALGRFAPSLRNMTRVIWSRSLSAYAGLTLTEIRAMKTHGEKRVRAILEVFYCIHNLVANLGVPDQLVVRLVPRLIDGVETWVGHCLQTPGVPDETEVFAKFVQPLLEQIRCDAAEQIVRLAENRLGVNGPVSSVRQVARTMGLTRARVYQLLNEINDIMNVRWPMGRHQVYELRTKFEAAAAAMDDPPALQQFLAAVELFYPDSRRGAAGPLERVALEPESVVELAADEPESAAVSVEQGNGELTL